jgi:hypothetical protein
MTRQIFTGEVSSFDIPFRRVRQAHAGSMHLRSIDLLVSSSEYTHSTGRSTHAQALISPKRI